MPRCPSEDPESPITTSTSCDLVIATSPDSEVSAAVTAYHLGIPNFKLFLGLRYLCGVWALFIGLFYEEITAWTSALLLLCVALAQTAARIKPKLWKPYRKSLIVVDSIILTLNFLGWINDRTLIRSLYVFNFFMGLAQLVVQILIWPSHRAHPVCFPTYKKRSCGNISTDLCEKSRENLKAADWKLKKLPFYLVWTVIYAFFLLMVCTTGQRLMIYPGTLFRVPIPDDFPSHLGLDVELVSFFTADRKRLSALFLKPSATTEKRIEAANPSLPRMTLWIFYGNTGNMIHQLDCVVPLLQESYPNLQFFIFSYRGYANSDGRPHISGLRRDIDAAVEYLHRRADVDPNRLLAYGHSIGGALVSDVLGRHPGVLKGVILSNTFLSMYQMARTWHVYWLKPFVSETWDSESALRTAVLNSSLPPILFMSSRKDELIPAYHMDGLYEIAKKAPLKHEFLILPEGTHNKWNDIPTVISNWRLFIKRIAGQT